MQRVFSPIFLAALLLACGDIEIGPNDPYADVRQQTVERINALRATLALAPLSEWSSAESCADGQAHADFTSGTPHSAFGRCHESAQNECPGWPSTAQIPTGCIQLMWNEGPGTDYSVHGHYINMTNTSYRKVAIGFYESSNHQVWALMDFAH